jgi:hypothetical protein
MTYVRGAVRSPSFPRLLDRFRHDALSARDKRDADF